MSLRRGEPTTLSLGMSGTKYVLRMLDEPLASFEVEALKESQCVTLPDGTVLTLRLKEGAFGRDLEVLAAGRAIPGSDTDPLAKTRTAAAFHLFFAILSLGGGGVATAQGQPVLAWSLVAMAVANALSSSQFSRVARRAWVVSLFTALPTAVALGALLLPRAPLKVQLLLVALVPLLYYRVCIMQGGDAVTEYLREGVAPPQETSPKQ